MTVNVGGKRSQTLTGFRFGIVEGIVNSRLSPTLLPRASYLTAAATGADALWVGDHLNAFMPRSIATPEYFGVAAKLVPDVDAVLEPWTMLGHLAARNRVRRLRLGVCVTDASRCNPAATAQAAATLHPTPRIPGRGPQLAARAAGPQLTSAPCRSRPRLNAGSRPRNEPEFTSAQRGSRPRLNAGHRTGSEPRLTDSPAAYVLDSLRSEQQRQRASLPAWTIRAGRMPVCRANRTSCTPSLGIRPTARIDPLHRMPSAGCA
jgi:hypothetical protein